METTEDRSSCETSPLLAGQPPSPSALKPEDGETAGGWAAEMRLLGEYSLPLIVTYLLQYSFTVITTAVAGHLGADDLAAASIGMTTINIVGFAVYEGMATALDTLCAQAQGSGHPHAVGLHVQRMLILMAIATVPIGAVCVFSPQILTLFVRQRHLVVKAGSFLRVSLVGIPGYASFEALKRFLQAQGDFRTAMVVLVICAPVNVLLSWLFAFRMGLGLEGAALGQALTNDLRPVLFLVYVVFWGKWSHGCWGGFSREAFRDWGAAVSLCVAGAAVNLGEWAAFEILTVSTSYLSTEHLAAQTILVTTVVIMWHIPFSVAVAASTRIGHLIGAGMLPTARRATRLYAAVFVIIGVFNGVLVFCLRDQIPRFFTDNTTVQELASGSMLAVAIYELVDSIIAGCNGMLRGLGRQIAAACIVFAVNYLAAVPFAMWLEVGPPRLGIDGVWIGLTAGFTVIAIVECVYMRAIRWQDCVETVRAREGI